VLSHPSRLSPLPCRPRRIVCCRSCVRRGTSFRHRSGDTSRTQTRVAHSWTAAAGLLFFLWFVLKDTQDEPQKEKQKCCDPPWCSACQPRCAQRMFKVYDTFLLVCLFLFVFSSCLQETTLLDRATAHHVQTPTNHVRSCTSHT
jgi:hypothetical protein